MLASKKRHSSDPSGHKKSKGRRGRHRKVGDDKGDKGDANGAHKGSRRSHRTSTHEDGGVVNDMDVTADEVGRGEGAEGGDVIASRDPETGVNDVTKDDVYGHDADVHVPNDLTQGDDLEELPNDLEGKDLAETSSLEVNMDSVHLEDRDKEFTEEELNKKIRKKVRRKSDADQIEDQDGAEGKRKSREEGAQSRSKRSSQTEAGRKHKYKQSGTAVAARHTPRRIRIRKEKIGGKFTLGIWKNEIGLVTGYPFFLVIFVC